MFREYERLLLLDEMALEKTILVVEDDADVRELAVTLLQAFGYRILEAETADSAFEMLTECPRVHIDLLFTDVVMPGKLDGIDLAERARQLRPSLKVLYASGFANLVRDRRDTALSGRVLTKPYRAGQLRQEIKAILEQGEPGSA